MTITNKYESKTLPAGTYIVGDPCYSIKSNEEWVSLLESGGLNDNPMPHIMECEIPEKEIGFVASGTAFGDGRYEDQLGNSYPVDSGMIGVVPLSSKSDDAWCPLRETWKAHTIEFDSPFTVAYNEEGVITIGHLKIDTGVVEAVHNEDQIIDEDDGWDEEA